MTEENTNPQTTIEEQIQPYDFVGGSITLSPYREGEMNGKPWESRAHIKIVGVNQNGKPVEARIYSQNAFDAILKILRSSKGQKFRSALASSIDIDELEQ